MWIQKKVWQQFFFTPLFCCCFEIRDPEWGKNQDPGHCSPVSSSNERQHLSLPNLKYVVCDVVLLVVVLQETKKIWCRYIFCWLLLCGGVAWWNYGLPQASPPPPFPPTHLASLCFEIFTHIGARTVCKTSLLMLTHVVHCTLSQFLLLITL